MQMEYVKLVLIVAALSLLAGIAKQLWEDSS